MVSVLHIDCEHSLIFLCKAKLLDAKPKHASGKAASNTQRRGLESRWLR